MLTKYSSFAIKTGLTVEYKSHYVSFLHSRYCGFFRSSIMKLYLIGCCEPFCDRSLKHSLNYSGTRCRCKNPTTVLPLAAAIEQCRRLCIR